MKHKHDNYQFPGPLTGQTAPSLPRRNEVPCGDKKKGQNKNRNNTKLLY